MDVSPEAINSLSPDYCSKTRKDSKVASNSGIHHQVFSYDAPVRDSSNTDKRHNGDYLSSDDNNPPDVIGGSGVLST